MPQGDKSSYTDKQKRQAGHIEQGYEGRGVSKKEAESRAWATVNKESGGGKKSGSGRGTRKPTPRRARAGGSPARADRPPADRPRRRRVGQRGASAAAEAASIRKVPHWTRSSR